MTAASSPPSAATERSRRANDGVGREDTSAAAAAVPRAPDRLAAARTATSNPQPPSVSLPLRFILTGIVALLTGSAWLVARPHLLAGYHYSPEVVAVTHLLVLGWIGSVIMGAMYQLVPVALETRLHSERLARWHYALHVVGFVGMVLMFRVENPKQVGHFGSAVVLGVGLFIYNLVRTLARVPRWNVVAAGIAAALFWLGFAVLAGLYLAAAKCWNFSPFQPMAQMHAHAHLGVLGFFVMMIVAVSFRLVPMFTLSEVQNPRRAGWTLGLLNAGLAGTFVTILVSSPWKLLFAFILVAGFALYGREMGAILRARKRRTLDWGVKQFVTALVLLVPVAVLGVVLAWPRLPANALTIQFETVYGLLALLGVVTLAILGMLYKIVPFLVWYASYSRAVGRQKVPSLADLYLPALQPVGYALFLPGLLTTAAGSALGQLTGVQAGCVLMLASFVVFAVNMGRILWHLVRPQLEPLAPIPAPQGSL